MKIRQVKLDLIKELDEEPGVRRNLELISRGMASIVSPRLLDDDRSEGTVDAFRFVFGRYSRDALRDDWATIGRDIEVAVERAQEQVRGGATEST